MITFRFKLLNVNRKTLKEYSEQWSMLLSHAFAIARNVETYEALSQIKKNYSRDFKLKDLHPDSFARLTNAELRLLFDVSPVFDQSPYDLRCYILAILGVRAVDEN